MSVSIRNGLPGTIEKMFQTKLYQKSLSEPRTTGSVKRMNLKEGDNVFAVTKATSVSIEKRCPSGLMPDVLCRDSINNIFSDVGCVVTDAFKASRN